MDLSSKSSSSLIDAHSHIGVDLMFYLNAWYPYALDWATLSRMAHDGGIGRVAVFPMVTNVAMNIAGLKAGQVERDGAMESVPYAFENRRMMEEIGRMPHPTVQPLPVWIIDPARSCQEQATALRKLKTEYPCTSLKIQGTVIQSKVTALLGDGGVLLDLAEEWNVPIIIHSSIKPDDIWSQCADILAVAKSRPSVRFTLAHSCRFDAPSLDEVASLSNTWFDCSAHGIHCQLATLGRDNIAAPERRFRSDYRNPAQVLHDLAIAYPGKLCWGTDAPFDSYVDSSVSLISSYESEAAMLQSLPEALRHEIACTNPEAFFAIKP
jgi:hypothetical protein